MVASTWRNSAKTLSSWSAGIPMPVSLTRYVTIKIVEDELDEAEDRVERGAQLVTHAGEELGFGPAGGAEALVEAPELSGGPLLLLVQPLELGAHTVHVLGEPAELVAV